MQGNHYKAYHFRDVFGEIALGDVTDEGVLLPLKHTCALTCYNTTNQIMPITSFFTRVVFFLTLESNVLKNDSSGRLSGSNKMFQNRK